MLLWTNWRTNHISSPFCVFRCRLNHCTTESYQVYRKIESDESAAIHRSPTGFFLGRDRPKYRRRLSGPSSIVGHTTSYNVLTTYSRCTTGLLYDTTDNDNTNNSSSTKCCVLSRYDYIYTPSCLRLQRTKHIANGSCCLLSFFYTQRPTTSASARSPYDGTYSLKYLRGTIVSRTKYCSKNR